MLVLGDIDDARGFALAGATTVRCRTRVDVVDALASLQEQPSPGSNVVLVSPSVYQWAREDIDRVGNLADGPLLLVLPESAAWAR